MTTPTQPMTAERWQRLKALFERALDRPPDQRRAFLAEACPDDPQARAEVERLLEAHERAGDFLWNPVAEASAEASMTGRTIGPYRIGARLGMGGMGEVYEASDDRLKRTVAIKLVPSGEPRAQAALWREAQHASGLSHPNICVVHDIGEADGLAYIVMERIAGQSLAEAIPPQGLPVDSVLGYATQIVAALAHAHQEGIIHRDLKSTNVMITPDGRVKVLDFGLARRIERAGQAIDTSSWTSRGEIAGTFGYMAPEILRGQRADARSDVWSVGVLLQEMLTGERPFEGRTPFDLGAAIMNLPPRPLPDRVPAGVGAVVRQCLEKDRGARYADGAELLGALETAGSGRRPPDPRPVRPAGAWSRFRRRRIAVAAALLLAAVVAVRPAWRMAQRLTGSAGIRSLVVLPLANVSGDPTDDYLADGVTDALIAELGTIGSLRVTSRTTAMSYRGSNKTVPQIARELGVDAVVEGSVARDGNHVRITAQLIDAAADGHLVAQTYEGGLREVLVLQRAAVRALAAGLKAQLSPREQERLGAVRTVDPGVYEHYLKGRYYWNKRTEESLRTAIEELEAAVREDPTYAPAYALLADSYNQLGTMLLGTQSPSTMRPRAAEAAIRALQIDPDLAEAHATLGYVKHYDWEWTAAEREFRRAIELNPSYALAHLWYGNLLASRRRFNEAITQIRSAEELDPLSMVVVTNVGWTLAYAARLPEAIEEYKKALVLDPAYVQAHWRLGSAYLELGRYPQALSELEATAMLTKRSASSVAWLAVAHATAGHRPEAERLRDELVALSSRQYVSPIALAIVYFALDDRDRGFDWLERAYAERSNGVAYLAVDARYANVRSDRRFRDLLRRVGLPE